MVISSGLVKLWHKPQKQVRHTMFFFDDKFPMIAHTTADQVCILSQWVDRCIGVHQFVVVSKSGRDLDKQVWS
jgi:hypothetical protein